jgi:hypothetical protein
VPRRPFEYSQFFGLNSSKAEIHAGRIAWSFFPIVGPEPLLRLTDDASRATTLPWVLTSSREVSETSFYVLLLKRCSVRDFATTDIQGAFLRRTFYDGF